MGWQGYDNRKITSEWAKIENGIVTQVIVADEEFIKTCQGTWVEAKPKAGCGLEYDDKKKTFEIPKDKKVKDNE